MFGVRREFGGPLEDRIQRARTYRAAHKGYGPDRLRDSGRARRKRAARALGDGAGWLSRLAVSGPGLCAFVVRLEVIGCQRYNRTDALFSRRAVGAIKAALARVLEPPAWCRLEVGRVHGHVHVHVFAHQRPRCACAGGPVRNLEALARYVLKSPFTPTLENEGRYLEALERARRSGRCLPRTSWSIGLPRAIREGK